jgi:hypothetical protein
VSSLSKRERIAVKTVALMRATERADYLVVNTLRALDRAWRPLGEILVERGLITPAQLQEALDEQK